MTTTRQPPLLRCLPALLLVAAVLAAAGLPRIALAAPDSIGNDVPARAPAADAPAPAATDSSANPVAAARDPSRQCEVPPEVAPTPDSLPNLTAALKDPARRALTIVVLGSLSGGGMGKAPGAGTFPMRLQAQLTTGFAARGAAVQVKVMTIGKTRAAAAELSALIRRQVLPLKPALVIWQVGRVDARQGNPPYRFSQSLAQGLDILQGQKIDAILADIQFHPQFEALYRTDDYRDYVRWLAGKRDLPLLRRYEMIEHWALSGLIDLDSANDADQKAGFEFIQDCIAYQATQMIMGGAGLALR